MDIVHCCNIVPSLVSSFGESLDIGLYFAPQLPRGFDHFYGAGRGGEPPPPHSAGRGGEPPPPRGEGSPRGGAPIPGNYSAPACLPNEGELPDEGCQVLTFGGRQIT